MKNIKRNITALLLLTLLVVVTIVVVLYLNNNKERSQTREEVSKIEVVEDRNKEREEKTLSKSIEEEEEREEDKEQIDNTERNRNKEEEEESLYRTEVEGELTEEYRDEILRFTYYSDWRLETHTDQERCQLYTEKEVKCYFIYELTNRFFLSIKLVYDIVDTGGGIFTDEKLGDYGVIQMDEYFLYRPEYFNYSSNGIPRTQLYFIDNREPKVGDFNYNWKQRGNYQFIVTYKSIYPRVTEELGRIDKKILEKMDRIVESVKFLD